MKTPRGCGEKFSAAGQLCKISEGNESNLVDVAPAETSSLPSAQLRTGAGTHTPRPRELRKCLPFDLVSTTTAGGYGYLLSQGQQRSYRFTLACSAELCAASASLAEIAAVSAWLPQLGASLPLPQARGR